MAQQGWLAAGIVAAAGLSAAALVIAIGGRSAGSEAPSLGGDGGASAAAASPETTARLDALEARLAALEQASPPASRPAPAPGTPDPSVHAAPAPAQSRGDAGRNSPAPAAGSAALHSRTTLSSGDPVPRELPRLLEFLKRLGAGPNPLPKAVQWHLGNATAGALDTDRAVLLEAFLARHADHEAAQGYLLRLLHIHTAWGRHERVVELLDRHAAATGIEAPRLLALRGGARERAGDHAGARRDYERILRDERVPPHVRWQAYLAVGRALGREGDHAAARAVYQQMLDDPSKMFQDNAGSAHLAIARSYRDEGNRAEAIAAYRKLLDREGDGPWGSLAKAHAKGELAKLEKDG